MRKAAIALVGLVLFAVAGATPASAASANQRFVITESNSGATFAATGPISGLGHEVVLTSSDSEDGTFHETHRVDFAAGSIFLSINGEGLGSSFDEATCTGRFRGRGTFEVTSGTKAYSEAEGGGTFTFRGSFEGCDEESGTFHNVVRARGHVTLD